MADVSTETAEVVYQQYISDSKHPNNTCPVASLIDVSTTNREFLAAY
ncbi:MAG: hypothetical protein ACFFC7_22715 [Candidatus Hermodarchaeota archaeon]